MENEWYERDKTAQRRQSASLSRLSLIVLLMALVASMMLPLYQRGINRSLVLEYRTLQSSHLSRAEQQRQLKASISTLGMPESLIDGAWREEIELIPITAQSVNSVARTGL
ncbi:MAG TPA: hypothetical protein PLH14_03590 [Sphaerochaeta sp.]|jgi:hypothetical protein|nr:hypothetical protein [Spirochaetota bacterium]NLV61014.1 hypothetical protein [Spirochaetales bacterium]HOE83683.1 hypothetical protein [Sphaerochaeta sp.]HOQ93709.1 hypothetical protein [Sphaerochaeta sp.]HPK46588.1 hypothetical protein [Sphaerochaeta sp.]